MTSEEILKRIKELVTTKMPDSEIYLYGSRARGDSEAHSDWDLLILLNQQNISFDFETSFMDAFYEIEMETGEVISPLIYTKREWTENHNGTPLSENIQKDGIRL